MGGGVRLQYLGITVYNVCTKTMASVETYCKSPAITGSGRERQVMDEWMLLKRLSKRVLIQGVRESKNCFQGYFGMGEIKLCGVLRENNPH